jgi:hypothetical protein
VFVEYAEHEWVDISDAYRLEFYFTEGGNPGLKVWRRDADPKKPERYLFEGPGWADYVKLVIRSAATKAAGEP